MPTSAPGRSERAAAHGFTLVELLVVLVLVGVLLAVVTLNVGGGADRALRFEAERLAQLMTLAREEAQVGGQPLRLMATADRYAFQVRNGREWRPVADPDLRERRFEAPVQLRLQRPDGLNQIEFGRDAVDVPFTLRLARDGAVVTIQANGLGRFVVQ